MTLMHLCKGTLTSITRCILDVFFYGDLLFEGEEEVEKAKYPWLFLWMREEGMVTEAY